MAMHDPFYLQEYIFMGVTFFSKMSGWIWDHVIKYLQITFKFILLTVLRHSSTIQNGVIEWREKVI